MKDSVEVPAAPDGTGTLKRGEAGDTPAGVSPALSRNCNLDFGFLILDLRFVTVYRFVSIQNVKPTFQNRESQAARLYRLYAASRKVVGACPVLQHLATGTVVD